MKAVLTIAAGVLFLLGFLPYIRAILRRETVPSKASWLIWAGLDTITVLGMLFAGSLNGQIFGAVAGAWVTTALALKYGSAGWTRLDKLCLGGAVLGIVLWLTTSNPLFGIVISQTVVLLGAVPTVTSAWKDPSQEDRFSWTVWWVSCVCAMFAIPQWTFKDAFQPSVFFLIETTMVAILYLKPRLMPAPQR